MDVNSKEYWNNRFSSDWIDQKGDEQTAFFSQLVCDMLPEWLINEVNTFNYSICDIGCAEGDSLAIYSGKFINSTIEGEDFSEKAIENAINKYPNYHFSVSNILETNEKRQFDVVICSNVVEHFVESAQTLNKLSRRCNKYLIVLIPYREKEGLIDEHKSFFYSNNIPLFVDNKYLVYSKSINCNGNVHYPWEQILLVYGDKNYGLLSDIVENVSSDKNMQEIERLNEKIEQISVSCENLNKQFEELDFNKLESNLHTLEEEKYNLEKKNLELTDYNSSLEKKNLELEDFKLELEKNNAELLKTIDSLNFKVRELDSVIDNSIDIKNKIISTCDDIEKSKSFKIVHLLRRINIHLVKGNINDKKYFFKWSIGKFTRKAVYYDSRISTLSPIMTLAGNIGNRNVQSSELVTNVNNSSEETIKINLLTEKQKNILNEEYNCCDVIILSIIGFDFRYQRPQHFASRFAQNGHRVFYINADFINPDGIEQRNENLYVINIHNEEERSIHLSDWSNNPEKIYNILDDLIWKFCIRDAMIIVDYPNWVLGADYLRSKYGFKLITDYMDDYTGFLNPSEELVADNCIRLLKISDRIIPSSDFLCGIASKYADNCSIVRNGTEFEHFNKALDYKNNHSKKVIGYYGAVAHWFDYKKVCYVAKKFRDCDIVIIGAVTNWEKELKSESNIQLLGEHSYKDLPKDLSCFDVCLIPFDTSTDLIKATNPVKFYEYLSAGKKIVSTEIPELMPFKDKYVYMSNDDEEFCDFIGRCLYDKDTLASFEDKIEFAKRNDWQERFVLFNKICVSAYKRVSIVVLSYNNLNYIKNCVESILSQTGYPNYELIVVDNNSDEKTKEWLTDLQLKQISNVNIIFNQENKGFAGGNNIGIKASTGEYIVILNNDTIVTRGWLMGMVKHLEKSERLGMIGLTTNSIGNECMIKATYHTVNELRQFAYCITSEKMDSIYSDVKMLPMFCTMIKKEVINCVGLLDENYGRGMFEDDDYSEAVKSAGYHIAIAEDSFIHHYNCGSFSKLKKEDYLNIFNINKKYFEKKWNIQWSNQKFRTGVHLHINDETGVEI